MISDSGSGIAARDLPRVFEPFFTTKSGGTGLGLDICRSIVWEYDGALWLESASGVGTTAHVRIPFARKAILEAVSGAGDQQ
jgi:signal transduction histidine kinase